MFEISRHFCMTEDLYNRAILRTFPDLTEDITIFMANTLLLTSDMVMNHKNKKEFVKHYMNPEPFTDYHKRNELILYVIDKAFISSKVLSFL
ncbi:MULTISPECIES: hypothetical protein [Bacillus cereus group]|uniref:hypothetical protein n=1 Tax=Bacillus cereus group TaxID=86661 RepID=UPI001AED6206|nr:MULTISPECIES: hypothetical protein [Bacillus cereus group]MDH2889821.1 hypothetical protein [Bacillus cytotoxicus]QTR80350.1 hypothetical protein JC773_07820 [Bacillus cytotoxicus]